MSPLPLPGPLATILLDQAGTINRSLLFDRGMEGYAASWDDFAERGKERFLTGFGAAFAACPSPAYASFAARRDAALRALGAEAVELVTQERLAIGLGLPHPVETGFLFDRLTGCPYLPGSSVKGLLRAAARLVGEGEIEIGERERKAGADPAHWSAGTRRRVFGPELGDGTPARGTATFYDAFPVSWPKLEVDVLTPHLGKYLEDPQVPPADWHNPVPVAFLTIAPGTRFRFFVAAAGDRAAEDLAQLRALLPVALDWLGIGAKKAAGYGVFGVEPPPPPVRPARTAPARNAGPDEGPRPPLPPRPEPPPPPPPPPAKPVRTRSLENVELQLVGNTVRAYRGDRLVATASLRDLGAEARERFKRTTKLRADVTVVAGPDGGRIEAVTAWRSRA